MDENKIGVPEKKTTKMEPQTIGVIKDRKKGGPFALLIIVILLIICVIGLPYIKNYFDKKENSSRPNNNVSNNPTIPSEEEIPPLIEEKFYDLTLESSISVDGVTYSNILINKENNIITLKANSINENSYDYENNNVYLEFYNIEKTLLERVKLVNKSALEKTIEYNLDLVIKTITSENASFIKIVKYEETDYPNISLNTNEYNEQLLVCINDHRKITYIFKERLVKINEVFSYSYINNLEEYTSNLNSYKEKATKMNEKAGITSSVVESNLTFVYNTIIDLSLANISALEDNIYYQSKTLPKVINFEMESRGYTCN